MGENPVVRTSMLALILAVATAAAAQQPPPATTTAPTPDFSKEKLTQIFSNVVEPPPKGEPNVKWGIGMVEFRALNMRWRFSFLPFLAPLPGSFRRTNASPIDPFAMTGTEFPYTPRTWRQGRELSKELQRIERTERERAKIRVKSE